MIVNALLRFVMASSIVFCGTYDQFRYWWLPLLALIIFVVRGISLAHGDARCVDSLADQTYYLAFIGTMSAILSVLLRMHLDESTAGDLRPMVTIGIATALTTLVGFFGMATLKEYAQKLADEALHEATTSMVALDATPGLTPVAGEELVTDGYKEVVEANRKLVELIMRIEQVLHNFPAELTRVTDAMVSARDRVHDVVGGVESDVLQMNSTLDELERLAKRILDDEEGFYAHQKR